MTALVVMDSEEAVMRASASLCGSISNPLLVVPLRKVCCGAVQSCACRAAQM